MTECIVELYKHVRIFKNMREVQYARSIICLRVFSYYLMSVPKNSQSLANIIQGESVPFCL